MDKKKVYNSLIIIILICIIIGIFNFVLHKNNNGKLDKNILQIQNSIEENPTESESTPKKPE